MISYIIRLMKCGYTYDRARSVCSDFVRNLSLVDLDYFIMTIEGKCYVG